MNNATCQAEKIEIFKSKKNEVYRSNIIYNSLSIDCVVKKYKRDIDMRNEVYWLKNLKENGMAVPFIYKKMDKEIIIEYINGDLLLDVIEEYEVINNSRYEELIIKIIDWFEMFYKVTYMVKGDKYIVYDVNLRNFICGDKFYGIDLEECRKGDYEEDIGRMCAFILTYDPIFTQWKEEFVKELRARFVERFNLNDILVEKNIQKELKAIVYRRKSKYILKVQES